MRKFLVFLPKKRYDYFPFGMLLPGRHANTSDYRYGFNGMEADNELKGEGNSYDFGERMYDPRIGRWFALDDYRNFYPNQSNYSYSLNDPLNVIDKDGDIAVDPKTGKPIYTSDGFGTIRTSDGQEIAGERRTYFSNKGDKISAFFAIAKYEEGKDTLLAYTADDMANLDEKYKSFCFADALFMQQLREGDDPKADNDNFKLVISGEGNEKSLKSILKSEFKKRTNKLSKAKSGDLAAFFVTKSTELNDDGTRSLLDFTPAHFSTYFGNDTFRSKDDINPILFDMSFQGQINVNTTVKFMIDDDVDQSTYSNIDDLAGFYYFLGFKT